MNDSRKNIKQIDSQWLVQVIMDAFRRIVFHYGAWFAETAHQIGLNEAMALEENVWQATLSNQMSRLSKTLGFSEDNGIPTALQELPRETLEELLEKVSINWLANDGIWFQAVEKTHGMGDAKRCNDTAWTRFSPFEAARIKKMLGLPDRGGLPALKKALGLRLYAFINEQSIEEVDSGSFIFRMNNCRVQAARKRRGLPDYPCKTGGIVEYTTFARTIDSRIRTECIGCPPDEHPEAWYCAWKFSMDKKAG